MMSLQEKPRFLRGLIAMGEFFGDDLSEVRQRLYWRTLGEKLTLAEWEAACLLAMERERFHKVPLPGVLMDYVREVRSQAAPPRALAPPEDVGMLHSEVRALIASIWPGVSEETDRAQASLEAAARDRNRAQIRELMRQPVAPQESGGRV